MIQSLLPADDVFFWGRCRVLTLFKRDRSPQYHYFIVYHVHLHVIHLHKTGIPVSHSVEETLVIVKKSARRCVVVGWLYAVNAYIATSKTVSVHLLPKNTTRRGCGGWRWVNACPGIESSRNNQIWPQTKVLWQTSKNLAQNREISSSNDVSQED